MACTSLPLVGLMTMRNGLGTLRSLEVRTDEHSNLVLELFCAGKRSPLTDIRRRGQRPPPLRTEGDNECVLRALAAWVNEGTSKVIEMMVYPTTIQRLGPTASAEAALLAMRGDLADALLAIPEALLAVSHAEVRAEMERRDQLAVQDKAEGLRVTRLRAAAWGIPTKAPYRTR